MKDAEHDILEKKLLNMPVIRNRNWIIFAEEYAKTLDHQKAYRKAYPNASPGTYTRGGYKLLQVEEVREYVDFILLNNLRNIKLGIKPSKILSEIQKMAYSPDHKYPNVKKDALNMLMGLYDGYILEELNNELNDKKETVDRKIKESELERKKRLDRQEKITYKVEQQARRRAERAAKKKAQEAKKDKK